MSCKYLQGWRLHNPSRKPVPALGHLPSKKCFLMFWGNPLSVFQCIASGLAAVNQWEKLGFILFAPSFSYLNTLVTSNAKSRITAEAHRAKNSCLANFVYLCTTLISCIMHLRKLSLFWCQDFFLARFILQWTIYFKNWIILLPSLKDNPYWKPQTHFLKCLIWP